MNNVEIRAWFEDWQQKLEDKERKEGARAFMQRLLRRRFGELSASAVARVNEAEVAELERWADRVLSAKTLDEVFGEPS